MIVPCNAPRRPAALPTGKLRASVPRRPPRAAPSPRPCTLRRCRFPADLLRVPTLACEPAQRRVGERLRPSIRFPKGRPQLRQLAPRQTCRPRRPVGITGPV